MNVVEAPVFKYTSPGDIETVTGPRIVKEAALETVGSTGTFSCSPVGPGGFTGCLTQVINQAKRERKEANEAGTAPEE